MTNAEWFFLGACVGCVLTLFTLVYEAEHGRKGVNQNADGERTENDE